LSDEFDGRVLNPEGVLIDLPFWVFKRQHWRWPRRRALDTHRQERKIECLLHLVDGCFRRRHA
jgi:hypothetical protein